MAVYPRIPSGHSHLIHKHEASLQTAEESAEDGPAENLPRDPPAPGSCWAAGSRKFAA